MALKITAPETAEYLLLESDESNGIDFGIRYYDLIHLSEIDEINTISAWGSQGILCI